MVVRTTGHGIGEIAVMKYGYMVLGSGLLISTPIGAVVQQV
jgi:hypothetical protein